jgi:membrane associated rhomboid family serine protease
MRARTRVVVSERTSTPYAWGARSSKSPRARGSIHRERRIPELWRKTVLQFNCIRKEGKVSIISHVPFIVKASRSNGDDQGLGEGVQRLLAKYAGGGGGAQAQAKPATALRGHGQSIGITNGGLGNGTFSLLLLNLGLHAVHSIWHPAWMSSLALAHWAPQWWQFITSGFVHANWEHLLSNCFTLLVFGRVVEEEEGGIGVWIAYLLCGAGGALASYLAAPHTRTISMGASAAVFGLFVVGVVVKLFSYRFSFRKLIEAIVLGSFVVKQVAGEAGMVVSGKTTAVMGGMSIGHVAHVGGALAGVLLLLALARLPAAERP